MCWEIVSISHVPAWEVGGMGRGTAFNPSAEPSLTGSATYLRGLEHSPCESRLPHLQTRANIMRVQVAWRARERPEGSWLGLATVQEFQGKSRRPSYHVYPTSGLGSFSMRQMRCPLLWRSPGPLVSVIPPCALILWAIQGAENLLCLYDWSHYGKIKHTEFFKKTFWHSLAF